MGRFGSVDIVNFGRFTKGFRRFAIRFAKVCGLENVRNLLSCSSRAMCFIGFVLVQVDDVVLDQVGPWRDDQKSQVGAYGGEGLVKPSAVGGHMRNSQQA